MPSDALASCVRTDAAQPTVELRFRFRITEFEPNQLMLVMCDQGQKGLVIKAINDGLFGIRGRELVDPCLKVDDVLDAPLAD